MASGSGWIPGPGAVQAWPGCEDPVHRQQWVSGLGQSFPGRLLCPARPQAVATNHEDSRL